MSYGAPIVVLGGGPAGAAAAGLIARHDVPVIVVERDQFPRAHVGESLQPATFDLLRRHLDLDFSDAGYARKYGAVYVWGESRRPWSVLFDERLDADLAGLDEHTLLAGDYEHAWQVDRATFDHRLLTAAANAGADVRHRWEAMGPIMDGDRVVGVQLRDPDGTVHDQPARCVLDCTGQRCLFGRQLGGTRLVSDMRATATYTYFDGAGGVPGPLGRHVQLVVSLPDGWAWFIPISATRTSVGLVHRLKEKIDPERFMELLKPAGLPLSGATRANSDAPLLHTRDWSFTHQRFAGPGWMLVGDAACFVDPVLSGGVDFAVRGAFAAAVAAMDGTAEATQRYAADVRRDYKAYLRLARYWYGNNRSADGLFWQAHESIPAGSASTPTRAFVYLTSGRYAADRHLRIFAAWQERRMFKALGVDGEQLAKARRER
jgi:FAD-dependent halogenase